MTIIVSFMKLLLAVLDRESDITILQHEITSQLSNIGEIELEILFYSIPVDHYKARGDLTKVLEI